MGWVEPTHALTSAQCAEIKRELSNIKNKKFSESGRQAIFLRSIEWALRKPVSAEFVRANAIDRLEEAAEAFRVLNRLFEEERGLLLLQGVSPLVWHVGNEKAAKTAADSMRLKRGEKDGTVLGLRARFLVAQMASAWRHAFAREPSAAEDGPFYRVANCVLQICDLPKLEKDALKRVLSGK